jgi:hypothetical protein
VWLYVGVFENIPNQNFETGVLECIKKIVQTVMFETGVFQTGVLEKIFK